MAVAVSAAGAGLRQAAQCRQDAGAPSTGNAAMTSVAGAELIGRFGVAEERIRPLRFSGVSAARIRFSGAAASGQVAREAG